MLRPWILPLVLGALAAIACAGSGANDGTPSGGAAVAGVTALFPARDATGVCLDAPLRLTFSASPTLGTAGRIQVFSTANPGTPVDTIDLAVAAPKINIAGRDFFYKPVIVDGSEAYVYLRRVLQAGQTYSLTIDASVFKDSGGQSVGAISDASTWRFSTRSAAPTAGKSELVVAADGSGDFCTVQGAIDAVPAGNTAPVTVSVRNGTYREIVLVNAKHAVKLRGSDRKQAVIAYPNNDRLPARPDHQRRPGHPLALAGRRREQQRLHAREPDALQHDAARRLAG